MGLINNLRDILNKSSNLKSGHTYSLRKDLHNPWPGLAAYKDPFGSSSKRLFCGRDNESFELTRMIDDNIFVTLYGKSGNGKTSLLNAGVFPHLRQLNYIPISIRLGIEPTTRSFQETIIRAIENTIKDAYIEEIWGDGFIKPMQDKNANEYLWNYFARRRFYADAKHERQVYPVIVLDQFEEVYKNRQKAADKLLCQIYYLMDESHRLESCETDNGLYDYQYNFRFVISIREDDLYYLEDSIDNHFLREMKQTRYRLLPITPEGAKDVILKPAEAEHLFAQNEEEQIVSTIIDISKGKVDTISSNVLSLICNRIYVHYYERQEGKGNISYELVKEFVSENPLEKFYLEATAHLRSSQHNYLEDNLVDVAGRRASVSKVNFDDIFHKRGDSLLSGPLKILQENNGRVELIHDSFCRVLLDQKAKRMERWRTYVEHIGLLLVCIVSFFMIRDIEHYTGAVETHGYFQGILVGLLEVTILWWALFLFLVIGVIRRSFASYFIKYGILMLVYPLFVDLVVMRNSSVHLSSRFYIFSIIMLALTISAWWFTRKSQPKRTEDRLTLSAILDFRSMKIWLFIFFMLFLINKMFFSSDESYLSGLGSWMGLIFLPSFFYGMFERNSDDEHGWAFILFMLLPISTIIYFTSDVEFLKFEGNMIDIFIAGGIFLGFLYLMLDLSLEISEKKTYGVIGFMIACALFFSFYALFYHYKFHMLFIWCLGFLTLFYFMFDDKSLQKKLIYLSTFLFIMFIYVFIKGYSPIIKGVQNIEQAKHWRWKNVVSNNGKDFRLLDAISGDDLLGIGFKDHTNNERLILSPKDSVNFRVCGALFDINGETQNFIYYVYPAFEDRIKTNSSKRRIVSLTFKNNRQRAFDIISKAKQTDDDATIQKTELMLIKKESEKIAEILNSGNDSIVKSEISRQLCKGVSCDILINTLNKFKSLNDNSSFIYFIGLRCFADSYYYEDLHGYKSTDWDGEFDNMVQWYILYLEEEKIRPKTLYLNRIIPALIKYYEATEDFGLKTQLYSKIVRLQQVAILYGLGKEDWSRYELNSPVGISIKNYYKKYLLGIQNTNQVNR